MPIHPVEPLRGHRYGYVLIIAVIAALYAIVAPDSDVSRGVGLLLQGGTLLVVIATARETPLVRDEIAALVSATLVALAVTVALGWVSREVGSAIAGAAVIAAVVVLVRGILRLLSDRGVVWQALFGALAVYLLAGLLFGLLIGIAARIAPHAYFRQGTDGTLSDHVYFSFAALTTTGFGDLTPATHAGRALAVLETLIGQIYLVTVISLLVGNMRRSRLRQEEGSA